MSDEERIEQLELENKILQDNNKGLKEISLQDADGLIEQGREEIINKIKAKIEYLLKNYDSENYINFEMFIKILQSLIEKE